MAGRGLRVWASLSGLVFVVLAVVGSILLFDGPSSSSPAKMAAYYGSDNHRWHFNLGWILTGLGLFALIWFVGALRERVRACELATGEQGTFLSTILFWLLWVAVASVALYVRNRTEAAPRSAPAPAS